MGDIQRVGDLEIDQDIQHEKIEWKIQRVAWIFMLLLLVVALLGLFGGGFFSPRNLYNRDLQVNFESFLRVDAPFRMDVKVLNTDEQPELLISRDYLKHFEIESIQPEPEQVSTKGEFQHFRFNRLESGTHILFDLKPRDMGGIEGQMGADSQSLLPVHHFVYP